MLYHYILLLFGIFLWNDLVCFNVTTLKNISMSTHQKEKEKTNVACSIEWTKLLFTSNGMYTGLFGLPTSSNGR